MAPTIGVNLRVTGHCNQGGRKYMEDMFSVAYQQTADELDLEYAYFGIFDGHGGHEAATFAKEHLMKAIVSQSGFWSDNEEDVLRAIKDGFIATHYAMWRNLENWPKTQSGLPSTSGTTASIAFIRRSSIYVGHVGDSCIVLGYQDPHSDHWKGAALTEDHKPESPQEYERINQAGGQVVSKAGVPRVVWHRPRHGHQGPLTRSTHIDQIPFLAVARSLGDLWSYNADSDRFVVSPEPDVFVHHIDLSRDRCLIFGTDGLWNMLSPTEAVNIVEKAEINNKSSGNDGQIPEDQAWLNPSKCLVDNAITKWKDSKLRADNTSAVTLLLDPLGPPHSQVLDQQSAASQSQSEFVPYHIESYKVNEGKSPSKLSTQTSGLAICTWYPRKNLNQNFGMTTLTTMEELFGEKIEIYDNRNDKTSSPETKAEEPNKEIECENEADVLEPSSSKSGQKDAEVKKLPFSYSSVLKSTHRNNGHIHKTAEEEEKPIQKLLKEVITKISDDENCETNKKDITLTSDENDNQEEVDENVNRMKLRGSLANKITERPNAETPTKNCQKSLLNTRSIKRNGKRGKKRKNYEIIKSSMNSLSETKVSRSKNKRRHSSLVETINIMYEPGPKRRTRSEDQRKNYENEDYRSDLENKLEEEINKARKLKKAKTKATGSDRDAPETSEETVRQNHLHERLHSNNMQDFTPMRLRSNMPVKTLRSRNINLENCDSFLSGLGKMNIHANRRTIAKQHFKAEESDDSNSKNLTRVSNVLTRSSLNSTKLQMNESNHRTTVHTRSQNKQLKK